MSRTVKVVPSDCAAPPEPRPPVIFSVDHLAKTIGQRESALPIIADIDFSLREGEFVSMVGPSGCGKTTLLMCLAGLAPLSGGAIDYCGAPLAGPSPGIS